jgi:hypothetical protein
MVFKLYSSSRDGSCLFICFPLPANKVWAPVALKKKPYWLTSLQQDTPTSKKSAHVYLKNQAKWLLFTVKRHPPSSYQHCLLWILPLSHDIRPQRIVPWLGNCKPILMWAKIEMHTDQNLGWIQLVCSSWWKPMPATTQLGTKQWWVAQILKGIGKPERKITKHQFWWMCGKSSSGSLEWMWFQADEPLNSKGSRMEMSES